MNNMTGRALRLAVALGLALAASSILVGCGLGTKVTSNQSATPTLKSGGVIATIKVPRALSALTDGKSWYGQAVIKGTESQTSLPVLISPAVAGSAAPQVPVEFTKVKRGVYALELRVFSADTAVGTITTTNPSYTAPGSMVAFKSVSEFQVLSDTGTTLTFVIKPQPATIRFDMDVFGASSITVPPLSGRVVYGLVSSSTMQASALTVTSTGSPLTARTLKLTAAPAATPVVSGDAATPPNALLGMESGTYQAWIELSSAAADPLIDVDPAASYETLSTLVWRSNVFTFTVSPGEDANPLDPSSSLASLTPTVAAATGPLAPGLVSPSGVVRTGLNNTIMWTKSFDDSGIVTSACKNGYTLSRKVVTGSSGPGSYGNTPWAPIASILTSAKVAADVVDKGAGVGTCTPVPYVATTKKLGLTVPDPGGVYTAVYYKITPYVVVDSGATATKVYGTSSEEYTLMK